MTPIFVSYFTGPEYEREAAELIETLHKFDLPHEVRAMPDLGRWTSNTAQKPTLLLEVMESYHLQRPVVWVDADARIRKRPDLLLNMPATVDFACHYRHGVELLTGTLYFGPTMKAQELVAEWKRLTIEQPGVWDQGLLPKALERVDVVEQRLPETYTYIFDAGTEKPEDVVILHTQASRRYRK